MEGDAETTAAAELDAIAVTQGLLGDALAVPVIEEVEVHPVV